MGVDGRKDWDHWKDITSIYRFAMMVWSLEFGVPTLDVGRKGYPEIYEEITNGMEAV